MVEFTGDSVDVTSRPVGKGHVPINRWLTILTLSSCIAHVEMKTVFLLQSER